MMQYNDIKHEALMMLVYTNNGFINDLEREFLLGEILPEPTEQQLNDLWNSFFDFRGTEEGHINDRMYAYLVGVGIPPLHINDMWYWLWENVIDGTIIAVLPYLFHMPGDTIENYEFDGGIGDYEQEMIGMP